jgi:hypothetical protein
LRFAGKSIERAVVVKVVVVVEGGTDALAAGLTVTVISAPAVKRTLVDQWKAFHSHAEPLRHQRLEARSAPHELNPDRSRDQYQQAAGEITDHAARGQKKDPTSRDRRCARGSDAAAPKSPQLLGTFLAEPGHPDPVKPLACHRPGRSGYAAQVLAVHRGSLSDESAFGIGVLMFGSAC